MAEKKELTASEMAKKAPIHKLRGNQRVSKREDGSTDVETMIVGESMTQQQFKDATDVNEIMKRYTQTGEINHLNKGQGIYLDNIEIPAYQDALDIVIQANLAFENLPAEVRKRFSNDPAELMQFLEDPKNREEGEKLGLLQPKTPSPQPNQTEQIKQNEQNQK